MQKHYSSSSPLATGPLEENALFRVDLRRDACLEEVLVVELLRVDNVREFGQQQRVLVVSLLRVLDEATAAVAAPQRVAQL